MVCSFPVRLEQSGIALFIPGLQGLFLVSLGRPDWLSKNQVTHSLEEGRVALRVLWNRRLSPVALIRLPGLLRFPTEPREPGSGSPCCGQPAEDQALKSDSAPGMLSPLRDRSRVLTARLPETAPILTAQQTGRGARVTARVPPKRRERGVGIPACPHIHPPCLPLQRRNSPHYDH